MLNNKKSKFWLLVISIVIIIAVGIGWITNPVIQERDALEQSTDSKNIPSGEEVSLELPEKSAAERLSDLSNHQFSMKGNLISDDDQETVVSFGKAFVNLYTGAIADQTAVSFKNYISNENLLKYTNKMLELEQRMELLGEFSVIFGLDNEFREAEFKKLDENLSYVSLPFSNQGSGMSVKMLVQTENKALKIVDFYFGNKDGIDTIVTGHPAVRKLHDPNLWSNQVWVDGVFDKLEKIGI